MTQQFGSCMRRVVLALVLLGVHIATPVVACPAWDKAQDAYLADNPGAASVALRESMSDGECDRLDRTHIARWAALSVLAEASQDVTRPDDRERLLSKAFKLAPVWSVSASLGDIARARKDHEKAARYYLRALIDMQELRDPASELVDPVPPDALYGQIASLAEEMRLLAPKFVRLPGKPACVIERLSGFKTRTALPIHFPTNKTTFTREGTKAAEELFSCLANLDGQKVRSITVEGHADERGSDQHNLDLSERRAEAVVEFLRGKGLRLPLNSVGHGEHRRYQPDNRAAYTREELLQMDRRVEVDVQMKDQ